jgi:proteic killer suppression protein
MDIQFKTSKLAKRCNDWKTGLGAWGERRAKILRRRLDDMRAAVTLEDLRHTPGDCHAYKGSTDHELTLDLDGGWRVFFRPANDPVPLHEDGASLDWSKVTCIEITDVRDPHG